MHKLKVLVLGSAAAILFTSVAQAATVTPLYSGGGTLAEKVYRDLMNCYGAHGGGAAPGDTTAFLAGEATGCNLVTPYNATAEVLYAGVGSGNGKAGFVNHNAALFSFNGSAKKPDRPPVPSTTDFGPYYSDGTGTGVGPGWTADTTGTAVGFPSVTFVGSDDPLTTSDINTYNANSQGWGHPVQVPGLATVVTIPYNPTAGWSENGKLVTGGGNVGNVTLTTNTLCGIFTGQINDWSDAHITKDNNNTQLGSGLITVVYRSDGSGTTFLTSNGLINQCSATNYPVPAAWQTAGGNAAGVGNNSFFVDVKNGLGVQNGTTNTTGLPANFVGQSGSGAVQSTVANTPGAVGYISPDFVAPVIPVASGGLKTINLEAWSTAKKGVLKDTKPVFKAPTPKNGASIVSSAKPPLATANSCNAGNSTGVAPNILSSDGVCSHNPLNWGETFPEPKSGSAYPIGGFTFVDVYGCYKDQATFLSLASQTKQNVKTNPAGYGFLRWYFGANGDNKNHVKTELTNNGFTQIPGAWLNAVKAVLFTDAVTSVGQAGTSTKCSGTGA